MSDALIPNSFQHPNLYIDWLAYYLTPQEEKVLNKAVREILGWREKIADRRARIALSIFIDGKVKEENGKQLCLGCGLSIHAIRRALEALDKYGILVKEGLPTQDGQMFRIQDDARGIDWDGLRARREKWDEANAKRAARATRASLKSRGITSDDRGNIPRYPNPLEVEVESSTSPRPRTEAGVTWDVSEGVTWDDHKETQKEEHDLYKLSLLWKTTLDQLRLQMAKATFDANLLGSQALGRENGTVTVQVRQPAVAWLNGRLRPTIERTLRRVAEDDELLIVFTAEAP